MNHIRFFCYSVLLVLLFLNPLGLSHAQQPSPVSLAQEETLEAKIIRIVDESTQTLPNAEMPVHVQKLEVEIISANHKGEKLIIQSGDLPIQTGQTYVVGDKIILSRTTLAEGNSITIITDYIRRDSLYILGIVFLLTVLLVGKKHGLTSLVGMICSFFVIFMYILPSINEGKNPVTTAIIGSVIIVPITFFLSHGWTKKTTVAIIGTFFSLILTGILASFFVSITRLTGLTSEEATIILSIYHGSIHMQGLLLAGIIISGIGVLDDITISQAAIVAKLKETSPSFTRRDLYHNAMAIGHDHIASVVNTLVLVYTGSALPLLILFTSNTKSFLEIINYEFIAEEIVKTLVASIGLILAVPITTAVASLVFSQKSKTTHT